jgi:hypothetical protein
MKLKYLIAYLLWVAEFYLVFAISNQFKVIWEWDMMSLHHFNFYGLIVGFVLCAFWYIDDNFNSDKK